MARLLLNHCKSGGADAHVSSVEKDTWLGSGSFVWRGADAQVKQRDGDDGKGGEGHVARLLLVLNEGGEGGRVQVRYGEGGRVHATSNLQRQRQDRKAKAVQYTAQAAPAAAAPGMHSARPAPSQPSQPHLQRARAGSCHALIHVLVEPQQHKQALVAVAAAHCRVGSWCGVRGAQWWCWPESGSGKQAAQRAPIQC